MAQPLGVRLSGEGIEARHAGRPIGGLAELATVFPVQAIDPEVHRLVDGGPQERRRYLDWGVFHVEPGYLNAWRIFRRALAQRNAALREQATDAVLRVWEAELAAAGTVVDEQRRRHAARLASEFQAVGRRLLDAEVSLTYLSGWNQEQTLAATLEANRDSDRLAGFTRAGPQRADLRCEINAEATRWRASKGQQKLLGAALVLAQVGLVAAGENKRIALIVDEPAADLDGVRLAAFLAAIASAPAQVFMACISTAGLPFHDGWKLFHVEHGNAKALL